MESQAKFASLIAFLMLFGTLTSLIVPVSADETVDNYPDGDAWLKLELISWEGNQSEEWDSGNGAPDPHFKVCVDADGEDIDCFNSPTWDDSWTLGPVWNLTFDIPDDSSIINFTIECRDNDALNDDECDMNPDPDEWKLYIEFDWTILTMNTSELFSTAHQLDNDTTWKKASSLWKVSTFDGDADEESDDGGEGGEENNTTNTPPSCFIHWYRDGDNLADEGMALLTAGDSIDEITVTEGDTFTIYVNCWDDDGDEITLSIEPPFGSDVSFNGTTVTEFIQLTVPTGFTETFEFGAAWTDGNNTGDFNFLIVVDTDFDSDGVYSLGDDCPNTPLNSTVNSTGCAEGDVVDSDRDGVRDSVDECVSTPFDERNDVDSQGCGASERDTDGDGVLDIYDDCPNTPTNSTVDSNGLLGCPESASDGDDMNGGMNGRENTQTMVAALVTIVLGLLCFGLWEAKKSGSVSSIRQVQFAQQHRPQQPIQRPQQAQIPAVVKELERQKSQAEMEAQRLKQQLASKSVSESKMDAMQAELANLQQRVADSEHVKQQMEQEIVEMKNKSDSSFVMQDSVIGGDSFVGGTKIENQTVNEPEAIARAAVEAYRMAKNENKD